MDVGSRLSLPTVDSGPNDSRTKNFRNLAPYRRRNPFYVFAISLCDGASGYILCVSRVRGPLMAALGIFLPLAFAAAHREVRRFPLPLSSLGASQFPSLYSNSLSGLLNRPYVAATIPSGFIDAIQPIPGSRRLVMELFLTIEFHPLFS